MRRIITVGTALVVLVAAGAAFAALNSYPGTNFAFPPGKAGSKAKPVPTGVVQTFQVKNTTPGSHAAPLVHTVTSFYGMIATPKKFAVCTSKMITANHVKWDAACPKNSRVATGYSNAVLVAAKNLAGNSAPCNVAIHVYNGGHHHLVFFLLVAPQAPGKSCATLHTGAAAPYVATVKQSGKNLITDVPLPPDVSTTAGGLKGVYGSIIKEKLTWVKGFQASVACKGKTRPWSIKYTAVDLSQRSTTTVKGASPCHK